MSKAFTKDDDQADAPLLVPRRAPLPPGTPNYVTPRGLVSLHAELAAARADAPAQTGSDAERARRSALHAARVADLEQRVSSAEVVSGGAQPREEVRFGAIVRFENAAGAVRQVQLVGVDEANAAEGKIAFVAPLARALLGKRVGDDVRFETPGGEDELTLLEIHYE
jgi:transcription elongation factor GreB